MRASRRGSPPPDGSRRHAIAAFPRSAHRLAPAPAQYEDGEEIDLYYNKVGPFHNPSEKYDYLAKGFCRINDDNPLRTKFGGFGEFLLGQNLIHSDYDIKFKVDKDTPPWETFSPVGWTMPLEEVVESAATISKSK